MEDGEFCTLRKNKKDQPEGNKERQTEKYTKQVKTYGEYFRKGINTAETLLAMKFLLEKLNKCAYFFSCGRFIGCKKGLKKIEELITNISNLLCRLCKWQRIHTSRLRFRINATTQSSLTESFVPIIKIFTLTLQNVRINS